jgi:hypothetical protein
VTLYLVPGDSPGTWKLFNPTGATFVSRASEKERLLPQEPGEIRLRNMTTPPPPKPAPQVQQKQGAPAEPKQSKPGLPKPTFGSGSNPPT